MKKIITAIVSASCVAMLLISCGTVRKASDENRRGCDEADFPADTEVKCDTFVPLHPPVVVPHSWREHEGLKP